MTIQDLFKRDIHRPINGVVKADQLDPSAVWQELDEFVVTRELKKHIGDLVAVLLRALEPGVDASGTNGVWISGFFGCGKSHFLKVLSYVLANEEHQHQGQRRRAVEFFPDKLRDALLLADLKKAVDAKADTVLFNIDSKADHRTGRDTLLQVFLQVLNEKQGYSGQHPHIAHMERHLDENGKLGTFEAAFERAAGMSWRDNRDSWEFYRDQVVDAMVETLGQSQASMEKWVDGAEDMFRLTAETFARWVKRYLDSRGPRHRVMFLVDEVGQFVGTDTHLMLNLQTVTELLGTICNGRAWVVVTSQEDLDAVLGQLAGTKQQDFSKIQGRFKTRLSLSSANVDEVIKTRLLEKTPAALPELAAAYEGKHDILKNQLSFAGAGMTFKSYANDADFAACYPFPAYQFALVQKVFESIRKAGATGLHLSQGERSTLDAFQSAARSLGHRPVGALAPFYRFYPAVEGFLDTAVKRTIDRASDNASLQPFDATLLQVLFLVRYIDELPGTVDNLVTLCVDEIDADRLDLRRRIEGSLARLEAETLIARNGDRYFFLTNEERDIGREIKNTHIPPGTLERELGKLIFEEVLGDARKHTYSLTSRDFTFTRLCDDHPVGNRQEGSLDVAFVSPLGDSYAELRDDGSCLLHTTAEQARLLVRLPDDPDLGRELRACIQTETYAKTRPTHALPDSTKRILQQRTEDNRARRQRIVGTLKKMVAQASWFARGTKLTIDRPDPKVALGEALEYLIKNAYSKMGHIRHLHANPKQEIQSTLRANDVEQVQLAVATPEANPEALADLRDTIRLAAMTNQEVILHDLVTKRYGGRPYGWPEMEVVLLVARLAVLREITLVVNSAPLPLDRAYDDLTSPGRQRGVIIVERQGPTPELIRRARALGHSLFAQQGPDSEEGLFTFLKRHLTAWSGTLSSYEPLARTGNYPGLDDIVHCRDSLRRYVDETDSARFLPRFVEGEDALRELADDLHDLQEFYANQRSTWETLRAAVAELTQNRLQLEAHAEAGPALARMEEILRLPRPYGMLHEVAGLTATARAVNDELVDAARAPVVQEIEALRASVCADLDKVAAAAGLRQTATAELDKLLEAARQATSIAHVAEARRLAEGAQDRALAAIEKAQAEAQAAAEAKEKARALAEARARAGADAASGTQMTLDPDAAVLEPPPRPVPPAPQVKARQVVEPRSLWRGQYIETPADVELFLATLRQTLEAAIAAGKRVQIK